MARRTAAGSSRGSWPATVTLPDEGRSSVASRRNSGRLAGAVGAEQGEEAAARTLNDTSCSTSRRPKRLAEPDALIAAAGRLRRPAAPAAAPSVRRRRRLAGALRHGVLAGSTAASARSSAGSLATCRALPAATAPRRRRPRAAMTPTQTRRTSGKTSMLQAQVRARRVERVLGDHEEVLAGCPGSRRAGRRRRRRRRRCAARAAPTTRPPRVTAKWAKVRCESCGPVSCESP